MGLVITASCSAAQHLAFAEVLERTAQGETGPAGLLVMMNGRLDETVAAELAAAGDPDPESVARWASAAITRRSYALLRDRGCRPLRAAGRVPARSVEHRHRDHRRPGAGVLLVLPGPGARL